MKSKKFVLAGFALLAITGLLALAGCKNDTVPETPAANLISISVTPPEGTVYKVGDEVVHKKDGEIGVTAHYDNETTRTVTGTITTDTSTLTQSAGVKPVTVSYSEGGIVVSGQFEIRVLPKKLTNYTSPNHTGSEWTYVEFGEWPQSEVLGVSPTLVDPQPENLFKGKYYSDANGEYVEKDGTYYKVEPIVWRVLNKDYASTGKALLLAESILTGGIPYYVDLNTRTITGAGTKEGEPNTVYPNNWQYSTIRAWLNGRYESDDPWAKEYAGKGFLQTAFTQSARKLIELTSVDNSADSTTDKIFLLSQQEATNSEYGFAASSEEDSTRIRVTTDYAEATGAYPGDSSAGYGGWWWLRSPLYRNVYNARVILIHGDANDDRNVDLTHGGVVPALSISLQ